MKVETTTNSLQFAQYDFEMENTQHKKSEEH